MISKKTDTLLDDINRRRALKIREVVLLQDSTDPSHLQCPMLLLKEKHKEIVLPLERGLERGDGT